MKKRERTPTRTAVEKYTEEEGLALYGAWGWLQCQLKAQERHDSSRNRRRRERTKKHREKGK